MIFAQCHTPECPRHGRMVRVLSLLTRCGFCNQPLGLFLPERYDKTDDVRSTDE